METIESIFKAISYAIILVPLAFILMRGFDRICLWLFDRYKNEVYIKLSIPTLTEDQKKKFKERLHIANHQSDAWYEADLNCVDRLCNNQELNYLDLQRLNNAISFYLTYYEEGQERETFLQISYILVKGMVSLEEEIKLIKSRNKLLNEQDIANKQLLLAKLSTAAAIFSAIAAIAASYLAYLQSIGMQK